MPNVFRVDPTPVMTTAGNAPADGEPSLYAVPGASVALFLDQSYTQAATAYTDATGSTACPSYAPVTLPGSIAPSSITGPQGQFGFWLAPGTYYYRITNGGQAFGPFPISVPSSPTGLPSGAQAQLLRIQPNTGNLTTYQWSDRPQLVSTDYQNFSTSSAFQSPSENISPSLRTVTLSPVPIGVNGSDYAHYVGIFDSAGVFQEAVLINGGTAASGAASGTITFASVAGTYATGNYKIGSATAGIQEAIRTVPYVNGYMAGPSVYVPAGKYPIYRTITNDNYASIFGAGNNSTILQKAFASGDVIYIGDAGSALSGVGGSLKDFQIQMLSGVTDTGGYAIRVRYRYNPTIEGVTIYGDSGIGRIKNGIKFDSCLTFNLYNTKILNITNIGLELAAISPDQTTGRIVGVDITSPGTTNVLFYCHGNILSMFIDGLQMQGGLYNWQVLTTGGAFSESTISNVVFDSAAGTAYTHSGTGATFKLNFNNICLSTIVGVPNTLGMVFDGTGASVFTGITLSNVAGGVNATTNQIGIALLLRSVTNFLLSNSQIQGAGGGVGDTAVQIDGTTKSVVLTGNVLGYAYDGGVTGSQAYRAVYVPSGTHSGMKITGNRIYGDSAALGIAGAHTLSDFSGNTLESGGTTASFTGTGTASFGNVGDPAGLNGPANYIATEGGANNAITGTLSGATLADGLVVTIQLAHTLQTGANTFALNGGTARSIVSHLNTANNIGTAYAATGRIRLCYNSTGPVWMDMSQ